MDKVRRISERSLENLKLGAQSRYQGKVRHNFTILPETALWLKKGGNASERIDQLVASAKSGDLKPNHTHERKDRERLVSEDVYQREDDSEPTDEEIIASQAANHPSLLTENTMLKRELEELLTQLEELKAVEKDLRYRLKEVDCLRKERDALNQEVNSLHTRNGDVNLELAKLRERIVAVTSEATVVKPVDKLNEDQTTTLNPAFQLDAPQNSEGLSQRGLGRRLGVSDAAIAKAKRTRDAASFAAWSQAKDPDGTAWKFRDGKYVSL